MEWDEPTFLAVWLRVNKNWDIPHAEYTWNILRNGGASASLKKPRTESSSSHFKRRLRAIHLSPDGILFPLLWDRSPSSLVAGELAL